MNIFFNFFLKTAQQSAIKGHQLPFKKPARFFFRQTRQKVTNNSTQIILLTVGSNSVPI